MQNNPEMFAILYGLGGLAVGGLLLAVFSWACKIIDKELFYDALKKQTEEV